MTSLYSPDLSLKYEMYLPSGDQAGSRSADPLEWLRLRTSPFSAGIVKISPRASATIALAGRRQARFVMRAVTSSHRGIIHGKSPVGRDVDDASLAGLWIELVDVAGLLEDDGAGARVDRLDVEIGERRDLRQLLRLCVSIRPDVGHAVAIGEEIHGVAHPDRIDVLRIGPGRRHQVVGLEVDDPDRTVLAAAIVASLLVPRVVHAIGDAGAVGGNLSLVARAAAPSAARRRPRPARSRSAARRSAPSSRATTQNMIDLPSGVQPCTMSAARMPRQPLRLAAVGRRRRRRRRCRRTRR